MILKREALFPQMIFDISAGLNNLGETFGHKFSVSSVKALSVRRGAGGRAKFTFVKAWDDKFHS